MDMPQMKRRDFLMGIATGAATVAISPLGSAKAANPIRAGKSLGELAFRPLKLGSIRPEGWLKRQLRIQADGLTGHIDEFWPDIAQSQWFGGTAEGWERAPYWLDGLIPLACLLDDEKLKAKARRCVNQIMSSQRADGWYAPYPVDDTKSRYDLWAILLVNKVLVQYHEATGDDKVVQVVLRNLKIMNKTLDRIPLFGWGKFRWFEGLISVYYVYDITGEAWLLDLARKLYDQGFNYMEFYGSEDITIPTPRRGLWRWDKHVVNTGMALKAYALSWRLTKREKERAFASKMFEILDRYHGQVTGMFTGDECLSGTNPVQGTELCAVVEALYSLEHLVSVTGDSAFSDRLERIAYNALPATFAPDMWSHQYDQQVNQVQCTINPDHMWSTNGPESNLYGLEPNYGCCTSNMHQGWPKFAANLWMRAGDGIAAVAYAPSSVEFESKGAKVKIMLDTDYPFRETIKITVTVDKAVRFPLVLHVPGWAQEATVCVEGESEKKLKSGSFEKIERKWEGTAKVDLRLPMKVKTSRRYNGAIAVERGPLVYSLKIGEEWKRVNADKPHRELPHGDFEVRPTTPWNYGLIIDEEQPENSVKFEEQAVGEAPFSPDGAGVVGTVKGRKIRGWNLAHGWAAEVQPDVHSSGEPVEELKLIPYGCTNIRVTEFPRLIR